MKRMKKLFALLLAVVMTMGLSVTAFAAQEGTLENGTITINNAIEDETYSIYQIAYIESYNPDSNAYAYKANSAWSSWLSSESNEYVDVENGYVKWTAGKDAATYAEFAKEALAYAQTMVGEEGSQVPQIAPDATKIANTENGATSNGGEPETYTVTFSNLKLGWYLVDTSLGSLCSLDTTNIEAVIKEKNNVPSIVKKVQEEKETDTEWLEVDTVDAVDTVKYQLTVTVGTGVDGNYVIKDELPDEISYLDDTLEISGWNEEEDYTVSYDVEEHILTITLMSDKLVEASDVEITYSANVSGLKADTLYTNTATLTYKSQSVTDTASVKTYKIDGAAEGSLFTKVDGTNQNKPLPGVKFALKNTSGLYAVFDRNGYLTDWSDTSTPTDVNKLTTDTNGHIKAYGLDADTYTLIETDPLPGYNSLADTITVTISEQGEVTYKYTNSGGNAGNKLDVVNETGTELPSTGGMGTTLIYIAGAVLVIGAGVLLVVRRRMNAER